MNKAQDRVGRLAEKCQTCVEKTEPGCVPGCSGQLVYLGTTVKDSSYYGETRFLPLSLCSASKQHHLSVLVCSMLINSLFAVVTSPFVKTDCSQEDVLEFLLSVLLTDILRL